MYLLLIAILILVTPFVVMPRDISKGTFNPYYCVLKSIIATMSGVLILFVIIRFTGQGLFDVLHGNIASMTDVLSQNGYLNEMLGLANETSAAATRKILLFYDSLLALVPGYIMAMSTLVSYFAYIIISKRQDKRSSAGSVKLMPKFKEFSFPPQTCMAMVAMYLIALLISKSGIFENDFIYQNINYLFDMVFVIQGFSVIFMICSMKRLPKAVAIIVVIVCWNFFMFRQIIVLLGMIDLIFGVKGFLIFKEQLKIQRKNDKGNRRR